MVFYITLALLVISIILTLTTSSYDLSDLFGFFIAFFAIATVLMSIVLIGNNITYKIDYSELKERQYAIEYKIENKDKEILSVDIVNEIRDWNDKINYGQRYQHDFWIGIFIHDYYDEFELIDYNCLN